MGYISLSNEKLHYQQVGTGSKVLLAFHGYGDSSNMFTLFREMPGEYTILAFDLPYHGDSMWATGMALTHKNLAELIATITSSFKVPKVSLLGYSLGGRICLNIAATSPSCIDKIVLAAPDGMTINRYYYFFTCTAIGKKLFRQMLNKPGVWMAILNGLQKLKFISGWQYKFIMKSVDTEPKRKLLLQVWPCLCGLIISPEKIKAVINQYGIPVSIFVGAYDKIITASMARKFAKGIKTAEVYVLEKGHRILDTDTARQIAGQL